MKKFVVRFTEEAEADLLRLFDFLLERDISTAERAELAIAKALELLEIFPFSCRKAAGGGALVFIGLGSSWDEVRSLNRAGHYQTVQ